MREEIIAGILEHKIIAILRGADPDQALEAAKALCAGGIRLVEVTFNQKRPDLHSQTTEAIRRIRQELGDQILVGAGTVLSAEQVEMAAQAGASYIISPDTDPEVIRRTKELGLVSLPGAYTATEAKIACNAGADFVKVFPCVQGASYIKALAAPMSHIRFLAVGGVSAENARSFLDAGAVGVGVGGCLANKKWMDAGEYDKITEEAKKFINNIKG